MNKNNLEDIGTDPNLPLLLTELQSSIAEAGWFIQQMARDYNTRFALWDGQSHDGRKHKVQLGREAFPFEGASDQRIRLADEFINEDVKMLKTAWRRSVIQTTAIGSNNIASAQKVTWLMEWLFKNHLKAETDCEVELLANWRQTHGLAVMGVFWEQERRLEMKQLDAFVLRDAAIAAAEQGDPGALLMMEKIMDPLQEPAMVEMLQQMAPILDAQGARKVLRDLRYLRTAEIPVAYPIKSLPRLMALRPFVDVFWQAGAKSLQRSRWVAHSEWLTETELRDRVVTDGWDADFVTKAIEQKGKSALAGVDNFTMDWTINRSRTSTGQNDYRDLIQVFHFYRKGIDRRTGVPALYCTIASPAVKDSYARHELAPYQHGKYPYVEFVRERIDGPMTESRGMADILAPSQNEVKAQRDARTDVTSITTMPPALVPMSRAKTRLSFGPGTQHGVRKPGEISWMTPPMNDGRSVEMERAVRASADRYSGRFGDNTPPVIAQLFAQDLTESFLGEMAAVGQMTLQLAQQYLTDMQVMRVVGNLAQPFHIDRDQIQGQFDMQLTFDARLIDMEFVQQKMAAFEKLLNADQMGVIDRAGYIAIAATWLDPNLAERVVRSPDAAAQSEAADEKNNLSLIINGIEPQMVEAGQNYGLRLQTLEETLRANPIMPQLIEAREDRKALLEARIKHLNFMIQQQQNASTGRTGAESGLASLQNAQMEGAI